MKKETLADKRYKTLMEIAIFFGKKVLFPEAVSGEDKRMVRMLEEAREDYVRRSIESKLPGQTKLTKKARNKRGYRNAKKRI